MLLLTTFWTGWILPVIEIIVIGVLGYIISRKNITIDSLKEQIRLFTQKDATKAALAKQLEETNSILKEYEKTVDALKLDYENAANNNAELRKTVDSLQIEYDSVCKERDALIEDAQEKDVPDGSLAVIEGVSVSLGSAYLYQGEYYFAGKRGGREWKNIQENGKEVELQAYIKSDS